MSAAQTRPGKPSEAGAALITVLFLLVVLTTVALSMTERTSHAVKRASAQQVTEQARWFALGAETLAIESLSLSLAASPDRVTLLQPWATEAGRFPIPGGFIEGRLSDAGNCFNVNSLVQSDDAENEAEALRIQTQFTLLMQAAGLADGDIDALRGPLIDWMDPDSRPFDRGAEDFDYLGLTVPYRAPNTLIADITELRALTTMTTELYAQIIPYLCALPTRQPSRVNVNTLIPEQAPLIAMLFAEDESVPLDLIVNAIANRPGGGFSSTDEFWQLEDFAGLQISNDNKQQVDIRTRYFRLNSRVAYIDSFVQLVSLIDAVQADIIQVRWRQIGIME